MYKRLICFIILAVFLLPTVICVDVSVKTNVGAFTERLGAGIDDSIYGSSIITREALSNAVWATSSTKSKSNSDTSTTSTTSTGSLSLAESHSVGNTAGAHAEVGVSITNAKSYDYSYALSPGSGQSYPDNSIVQAAESLNVNGAMAVNAYAKAYNNAVPSQWYDVGTSITVRNGDLLGYSNLAIAAADATGAFQSFDSATGAVQCDSTARTLTSAYSPSVEQMTSPEASIKTKGKGTIANYEDAVVKTKTGGTSLEQNARVYGAFTSTSAANTQYITRSSDYGTKYDIDMQANIANNEPSVKGILAYYINPSLTIQGAIDKSRPGDTINLAEGTYNENVNIPKAVTLRGDNVAVTSVTNTGGGSVYLNAVKVFIRADDLHARRPMASNWTWFIGLSGSKNFKTTIAVVPNGTEGVNENNAIPFLQTLDKNRIELADHGYMHEDFPGLGSYDAQYNTLKAGTDLLTLYIYRPRTFVAPFLDANADTVNAAKALGYHTICEDTVTVEGMNRFVNDFEWEYNWNKPSPDHHTEAEFETAFNAKYNAGAKIFEIAIHPDDSTADSRTAFAQSIDFLKGKTNPYGSGVEFMTMEQYYRLSQ